jgi:hypothetical protein
MTKNNQATGKERRVLAMINRYPTPMELYESIFTRQWPYKKDRDFYIKRDRALAAILYLCALRISEARRLVKSQFKLNPFRVEAIKLSKAEKHNSKTGKIIIRKDLYRKDARIPLQGDRGIIGQFILDYLALLEENEQLFPFSNSRADQIIKNMLDVPPHWLRAYGENYLYDLWDKDLLAVASYVQVDPRTLTKYVHGTHTKYLDREI